jgi:hypothetical protein
MSRQRDKDGDGKLTFEEYFHGLHDHIHGMMMRTQRFLILGT